jgi:phage-related protein
VADDDINASVLAADLARLSRDMDDTSASARALDRGVGTVGARFDALEASLARAARATDLMAKSTAALAKAASVARTVRVPAVVLSIAVAVPRGVDAAIAAVSGALTDLGTVVLDLLARVPLAVTAFDALADRITRLTTVANAAPGGGGGGGGGGGFTFDARQSGVDIGEQVAGDGIFAGLSAGFKALPALMGKLLNTTPALTFGLAALGAKARVAAAASAFLAPVIAALSTAMTALGAALAANPIGAAVIVIVALAAAFYLAYTRIGWFRNAVNAVFSWIRTHWPLLVAMLTGPLGIAVLFIVRHFGQIVTAVRSLPARIGAVARTLWSGFRSAASSAVHVVADRLRGLVSFVGRLPGSIGKLAGRIWKAFSGAADGAVHWVADRLRQLVAMIGRIPGQLVGLAKKIPGAGLFGKGINLLTGGGKDDKKPATPKPATAAAPRRSLVPLGAGPSAFDAALPTGTNPKNDNAEIAKHMSALKDGLAVTRNINLHIDGQKVASVVMRDWEDRGAAL